jgi:hypothetical protein
VALRPRLSPSVSAMAGLESLEATRASVLALEEPGDGAEQRVGPERLGEHVPRQVRVGKGRDEQDGWSAVQARQVCRQGAGPDSRGMRTSVTTTWTTEPHALIMSNASRPSEAVST